MKEYTLLHSLSHIDEAWIEEANQQPKQKRSRPNVLRWVSLAAALSLVIGMFWFHSGTIIHVSAEDLMEGITPRQVEGAALDSGLDAVTDFSFRLTQTVTDPKENTLISPLSVLYALSMTANGAQGETLEEMEAVLGMPVGELNGWLHSYRQSLDEDALKLANSIWFKDNDRFVVNQGFLQVNADYYGADIYKAPFDDTTLQDINRWGSYHTDGMIPETLKDLPEDTVMCLMNALCFDAKWETEYRESQIRENFFKPEDSKGVQVDFLYSTEDVYLHDEFAEGFIKPYKGEKYGFLALLPNEGISVEQYLNSLTGSGFQAMLDSAESIDVHVAIPKFETEFSAELSDALKMMGMELAFDEERADLYGLGTSGTDVLYIDQVLHKTYICLDEQGTRAAAVTSVMIKTEAVSMVVDSKTVHLDRPFVYMILDMEAGIPVFIGTMMDPTK